MVQYATNLVDDEPSAEDIVEESFVKLWEKRLSIQNAGSVKSYLHTIVKNACFDYLNNVKKEDVAKKEIGNWAERQVNPFQDQVSFPPTHLNIEAALQQLPRRKEQIFRMFHLEDKSIQQIATELNLSPGSVKNQKSRALELLRSFLLKASSIKP